MTLAANKSKNLLFPVLFVMALFMLSEWQLHAQGCGPYIPEEDSYKAKVHDCLVDVQWYDEWEQPECFQW